MHSLTDLDLKPIKDYLIKHSEDFACLLDGHDCVCGLSISKLTGKLIRIAKEILLTINRKLKPTDLRDKRESLIRTFVMVVFASLQMISKTDLPIKSRIALQLFSLSLLQLSPASSLDLNLKLAKDLTKKHLVFFFDTVPVFLQAEAILINDICALMEQCMYSQFNKYADVMQYLDAIRFSIDVNISVFNLNQFFIDGVEKLSVYLPEKIEEIENSIKSLVLLKEILLENFQTFTNQLTEFLMLNMDALAKIELIEIESMTRKLTEIANQSTNEKFSNTIVKLNELIAKINRKNAEDEWLPNMVKAQSSKNQRVIASASHVVTKSPKVTAGSASDAVPEPAKTIAAIASDAISVSAKATATNVNSNNTEPKKPRNRRKERHAAKIAARQEQQPQLPTPIVPEQPNSSEVEPLLTPVVVSAPAKPAEKVFSFQCAFFHNESSDGKYHLLGPNNFRYASFRNS